MLTGAGRKAKSASTSLPGPVNICIRSINCIKLPWVKQALTGRSHKPHAEIPLCGLFAIKCYFFRVFY